MGDYERRHVEEQNRLARIKQAKIDEYRRGLIDGCGRCETCKYWDTSVSLADIDEMSPCRINPPIAPIGHQTGQWPFVSAEDWCGSHVLDPVKVDELCMEFANGNGSTDFTIEDINF